MCGIFFQVGGQLYEWNPQLQHRGPDYLVDEKFHKNGNWFHWLFSRLAIVDKYLPGRQPFVYKNDIFLLMNGEVYNHQELRECCKDFPFSSGCDCEAFLALYVEFGVQEALKKASGMFAFVLVDFNLDQVIVGRDRFGIKPLFWCLQADHFLCASEMKAIPEHLHPRSHELRSGYILNYDLNRNSFTELMHADWPVPPPTPHSTLSSALTESVRLRIAETGTEDVGVLLSGGVDSSLIAVLTASIMNENDDRRVLHLFTSRFDDGEGVSPDSFYATLLYSHIQQTYPNIECQHHMVPFDSKVVEDVVPEVVRSVETWDENIIRASIPLYLISQEVEKRGIKVVLCGEGADELFGGYSLFADYDDVKSFTIELERRLFHIGSSELVRVDRATMAFGVEARVPFLDEDFVRVAMSISSEKKMNHPKFGRIEKYCLRAEFTHLLPGEILWRRKEQFANGVGNLSSALSAFTEHKFAQMDTRYFHELWMQYYPLASPVIEERHTRRKSAPVWNERDITESVPVARVETDLPSFHTTWMPVKFDDSRIHLTNAEVKDFLHQTLKMSFNTQLAPTLENLNLLIRTMLMTIPFQNLSLLCAPRRPPTHNEIKADLMKGTGGGCAQINPFFASVLAELGYDVALVPCTIHQPDCHVCLLINILGKLYWADVGNSMPYFEAVELGNFETHHYAERSWRLKFDENVGFAVQHLDDNKWTNSVTFNPTRTFWLHEFQASIAKSRSDPSYGPFLRLMRIYRFTDPSLPVTSLRDTMEEDHLRTTLLRHPPKSDVVECKSEEDLFRFVDSHFGDIKGFSELAQQAYDILNKHSQPMYRRGPSKMKVMITGGAGFVGSHVVEALIRRGTEVVVVDNLSRKCFNQNETNLEILQRTAEEATGMPLHFHEADITDQETMRTIFEEEKPTVVCHLAALVGVRQSLEIPGMYNKVNVQGTSTMLELACQFNIENFVYASSSSVYGKRQAESVSSSFTEIDTLGSPLSPYAATKLECERLAKQYSDKHELSVTGLRFFTVYGPRGRPDMAAYKFVDHIVTNQPIPLYGDGSSKRDYTYVEDIVDGVVASLDNPKRCEIYNLGNSQTVSLSDFISLIEKILGKTAAVTLLPEQIGDMPLTHSNIDKARRMLGYNPQTGIEPGLTKFVSWYQHAVAPKLVAVIATNQRKSDHLPRAIRSVMTQSRTPDALVVVSDDFDSTLPTTEQDIKDASDGKGIYLTNSRTRHVSGTGCWNTGIMWTFAHFGEDAWIAILDDDDEWRPNYLEDCFSAATNGCEVKWVASDLRFIKPEEGYKTYEIPNRLPVAEDFFVKNPGIQGSNMFVKCQTIIKAGMFDESLRSATDRDLCIRLSDLLINEPRAFVAIKTQAVLHYADDDRVRVSTPGSLSKREGLIGFLYKYGHRMNDDQLKKFKKRSKEVFAIDLDDGSDAPPDCESELLTWNGDKIPVAGASVAVLPDLTASGIETDTMKNRRRILVGIISNQIVRLKFLLSDLKMCQEQAVVVIFCNSEDSKGLEVFQDHILKAKLVGCVFGPDDAIVRHVLSHYTETPSFPLPIAQSRTVLQFILYTLSQPLSFDAVVVLDDDKRLRKGWTACCDHKDSDIFLGRDIKTPPNVTVFSIRTQLLDMLFLTDLRFAERKPLGPGPSISQHDQYYDLSTSNYAHLERPFFLLKDHLLHISNNEFVSCCRRDILTGSPIARDCLPLEVGHSTQRGGCMVISKSTKFDLLRTQQIAPKITLHDGTQAFTRRSDSIWVKHHVDKNATVVTVKKELAVIHDNIHDMIIEHSKMRQLMVLELCGAMMCRPQANRIEFIRDRVTALKCSILRIKGLITTLKNRTYVSSWESMTQFLDELCDLLDDNLLEKEVYSTIAKESVALIHWNQQPKVMKPFILRAFPFEEDEMGIINITAHPPGSADLPQEPKFVQTSFPTKYFSFLPDERKAILRIYEEVEGIEAVVYVKSPEKVDQMDFVPVRIHSECFTGDLFLSEKCDCGDQLNGYMKYLAAQAGGVLIYLFGHEGRGAGRFAKIQAYKLRDENPSLNHVDALVQLGCTSAAFDKLRDYTVARFALRDLGIKSIALHTNNKRKLAAMEHLFPPNHIRQVSQASTPTAANQRYLYEKHEMLEHDGLLSCEDWENIKEANSEETHQN